MEHGTFPLGSGQLQFTDRHAGSQRCLEPIHPATVHQATQRNSSECDQKQPPSWRISAARFRAENSTELALLIWLMQNIGRERGTEES